MLHPRESATNCFTISANDNDTLFSTVTYIHKITTKFLG